MINLLPPDMKSAYRYGLRNVVLVRWVVAMGLGLVGLVVISTAGLIYTQQTAHGYDDAIASGQALLEKQKLGATQTQVKDISSSLKLAVQVLGKEVLFSKLLDQLAKLTPSSTILTDLTIAQGETAITITAKTTDYTAATQLQVNLSDPANKIFSHADILSITCTSTATAGTLDARYPCSLTLRALFATNNPFLFINDKGH